MRSGAFQERRVRKDVPPPSGGEQRQTDRHGERGLEVEREGRGDRRVEDAVQPRLEIGAEGPLFGIETAPIQHGRDPAGAIWPAPSGSVRRSAPMRGPAVAHGGLA